MRHITPLLVTLAKLIDVVLKLLIPPAQRQICYNSSPDYSDNSYHLYQYCLTHRSDIKHVWIVDNVAIAERIQREFKAGNYPSHQLQVVRKASVAGYLAYLRSRVCVHTHGLYYFSRWAFRRQTISLWHGMPIKVVGQLNLDRPNKKPTFGSSFIASSSFFQPIIACCFGAAAKQVLNCYQPRCDLLHSPELREYSDQRIRQKIGLNADQRFLLWMPTYRTEIEHQLAPGETARTFLDDLPTGLFDALLESAAQQRYSVVLKLHPYDRLNQVDFPIQHPNLTVITASEWAAMETPLYELVASSSALMTDVSSVMIDYLISNKPIGVIGFDPQSYTRDVIFPPQWLLGCEQVFAINEGSDCENLFSADSNTETDRFAAIFNAKHSIAGSEQILTHCEL